MIPKAERDEMRGYAVMADPTALLDHADEMDALVRDLAVAVKWLAIQYAPSSTVAEDALNRVPEELRP